jgi:histidine triad (HIT) family protein
MKFYVLFIAISLNICIGGIAQQSRTDYQANKAKRLGEKSPFEKIIDREQYANIVYENKYVIVFTPIVNQAPIHYLIVPKKRIATVNEAKEEYAIMLGHLFIAANTVAKKYGITENGYRLIVNTNQDAGQSVFHLHMHLVGGTDLGRAINAGFEFKKDTASLNSSDLERFVGDYQLPGAKSSLYSKAFVVHITKKDSNLFLQIGSLPKMELFAIAPNRFYAKIVDRVITFEKEEGERFNELVLIEGGEKKTAQRIK